jgi:autotransporter-associated beta strand protein
LWSTLAATWTDRSTTWVRDAKGIFDRTGGTVTVAGTVLAGGGLEFATDGYEVGGGTLHLSGFEQTDNTVTVAADARATISARLMGLAGLRKAGGGRLDLSGLNTSLIGGIDVAEGTLRIAGPLAAAGGPLTIQAGARAVLADGLEAQTPALVLAGGLLDLGTGRLTVSAGGISAADLRAAIVAGRQGGGWNGSSGIVSSAAADAAGSRVVGYALDSAGVATVAFAAPGDVDLDGVVDVFDLVDVNAAGQYGTGQAAVWSQGDFNYDAVTNVFDLVAVSGADVFNRGSYLPAAMTPAAVPEPGSFGLLGAAAGILLIRRRSA